MYGVQVNPAPIVVQQQPMGYGMVTTGAGMQMMPVATPYQAQRAGMMQAMAVQQAMQQAAPPMPPPPIDANCPPGLEYLSVLDQLFIHEQMDLMEMMTGLELCNRYTIKNNQGQRAYFAAETSEACHRQCCGSSRAFSMKILDNAGREVINMKRPFRCCSHCGCSCNLAEIGVYLPNGEMLSTVKQNESCCDPFYSIYDASGHKVLHLRGPNMSCVCLCCPETQEFRVLSRDEKTNVGSIKSSWTNLVNVFSNAENFGVQFPMDMAVGIKAGILAATFLIHFMFFENHRKKTFCCCICQCC